MVYEVGPRDGLQNEERILPSEIKVRFVEMLAEAGLPKIEATSFVRPGVIPQLSDASKVYPKIRKLNGQVYTVLIPNRKGMELALDAGAQETAIFAAASESFFAA